MTITRINEFHAREGEGEGLFTLVKSFLPQIEKTAGCRSCKLLRHHQDPNRLVVVEEWDSVEAHQAARQSIPSETMVEAMKLLAAPPTGEYWTV